MTPRPLHILMLNYEYPPLGGGAAPVAQKLCELYTRRGHSVTVVTMGYRGLPRREQINGVDIIRVPALRKRQETCQTLEMMTYVISAFPRVLRMLRKQAYDVIHAHFIVPTGLLAYATTRLARTPYVITAHGSDIPGYNNERFTVEHRITKPLLKLIASRAARLVAPSLFLKGLIEDQVGPYSVLHIPNGITLDQFSPKPKQKRILMTGRLLERKGFQYVLEALQGVETDFEVHIAGDGPLREQLEALAAKLPLNVVFHGWLGQHDPKLWELYETSAIFCLPSEKENASISLLEAMASRMAVITSDISGCPETVGDAGVCVPPRDAAALRAALSRLLGSSEEREALGAKARQRAEERFDWEVIGDEYLRLLTDTAFPAAATKQHAMPEASR